MQAERKIYSSKSGECVAKSFRSLKRKIHNRILKETDYYIIVKDEKRKFEVITKDNGKASGYGKGKSNKCHGCSGHKYKNSYSAKNGGIKISYHIKFR